MSGRLTDQERRDRALSEDEWRQQVNDLAEIYGWSWMTVGPLRTSHGWRTATRGPLGKGWPDGFYIRLRDHRVMAVEFKKELGKVDPDQVWVLEQLAAVGIETFIWRPGDIEEVKRVLAA